MPATKSVLLVEDDVPLRDLYRRALSMAGFAVREVGDGFDALHAIDTKHPDLVVLDLGLPRLSGQAVLEELAGRRHTRHIRVMIVTGRTGPDVDQLQADCLFTKPLSPDELVEAVRKCLASKNRDSLRGSLGLEGE